MATAAKCHAFLKHRGYVIPEDVRAIIYDVLRHRIGLTYEAEAENVTTEDLISQIINEVEVPLKYWSFFQILFPMDTKELLKKVRKIEIKTRRLSDNIFGGEYHSTFKGRGMTFSEVRQYQYGDDVRSIDWNVTARYNEPFVKVFEEERELTLMLMIDISGSELFGTQGQFKREELTEIAATLSFSAMQNNDKVGMILFSDQVELFIPPKKAALTFCESFVNFWNSNLKVKKLVLVMLLNFCRE